MQYTVEHRYTARRDGVTYGPWAGGEKVELSSEEAAWINRDSPGTLAVPAPAEPTRAARPTPDRQHHGGRNRGR